MVALEELGYDKDRKPEQVAEIKRGLKKALAAVKNPQIVNSAWGSGKTVTITVIAFALSKLMPEAPILIALLNEAEAERMTDSFEKQKLKVRKCLKGDDFAKGAFGGKQQKIKITITIHKALAQLVYFGRPDVLKKFYSFIDEVDRFSELSPLGFRGSKDVMKLVKFFYGTSADELTPEDKGPNGLDCPPETEFIKVGKRSKNVKIIKITESGNKLYEKLGTLAKDKKLLLCVNDRENMIICKDLMVKHGKINKDRIITFDPETAHHQSKQNWGKVAKLMKEPDLLDVVVTWAGGNRSHNYFPSCLPVAMFKFEHEKELHQLAGRSERMDNECKEFIVACVTSRLEKYSPPGDRPGMHQSYIVVNKRENPEKEAAKVKEEGLANSHASAKDEACVRLGQQEDEEMDTQGAFGESDNDNQIKEKKTVLVKRTRATRNQGPSTGVEHTGRMSTHDKTNKKQKKND